MRPVFPLVGARVALRPFVDGDEAAMSEVYGDPEVMRHVADGSPLALDAITALLREYRDDQQRHGFACWAVLDLATGEVIGDAGFEASEEGAEFGYTLGRAWWGRGLATEAGALCVRTAVEVLRLPWLSAIVDPANAASARVLEKLGFVADGDREAYGRRHRAYLFVA